MKRPRLQQVIFSLLALFFLVHVGSYITLAGQGKYEPAVIGADLVKSYAGAPRGFYTDGRWNDRIRIFYMPLYLMDRHFWHYDD